MTRRHNAIHTMAIIYQKVVASSTQIVFNFVINDNTNKFAYNLDVFFLDIRILNVLHLVDTFLSFLFYYHLHLADGAQLMVCFNSPWIEF